MAPDGIASRTECIEQVADSIVGFVFLKRKFRIGPYLWLLDRCFPKNLNKAYFVVYALQLVTIFPDSILCLADVAQLRSLNSHCCPLVFDTGLPRFGRAAV